MFLRDPASPSSQFLQMQPWFGTLPEALQDRLLARTRTLQGDKGEVMLHAGEAVKGWYAVLSGLVKLQSESAQGRRQGFLGIPGGEWFARGNRRLPGARANSRRPN